MSDLGKNDSEATATNLGSLGVAGSPNGTHINFLEHDSVSSVDPASTDLVDYFRFSPEVLKRFTVSLDDLSVQGSSAGVYIIVTLVKFLVGTEIVEKVFVKESGFSGKSSADYYRFQRTVVDPLSDEYGAENVFINKSPLDEAVIKVAHPNTSGDEVVFRVSGYSVVFKSNGDLQQDAFKGFNYKLDIHAKSGTSKSNKYVGDGKANTIKTGKADDVVLAKGGDDVVISRGGKDKVLAGSGNDFVNSGKGGDKVVGGAGEDELRAGAGNDLVKGGMGKDLIRGANGNDRLSGNGGDDSIFGASGNDLIRPGKGDDEIWTGAGKDLLFFGANQGENVVWDFEVGQDLLNLSAMKLKSKNTVMKHTVFDDGGSLFDSAVSDIPPFVHLSLDGTDIYLVGENILDFSRSDFLI